MKAVATIAVALFLLEGVAVISASGTAGNIAQLERAAPIPWALVLNTRFANGGVTTTVVPDCRQMIGCAYYDERGCHEAAEHYEAQVRMTVDGNDEDVLMAQGVCIPAPRG